MIKIKKLNSKIRVIMEHNPYVKSVAFGVFSKVGAVNENAFNSGISHFVEHMMFKGTHNRTAKKIAEDIDILGGQINAFTGKEVTCYYVKALYDSIEPSMDVIFDMLLNSKIEEEELDKERNVILEEMKMIEDDPDELAHDMIIEEIFKDSTLSKSIIGTNKSLHNINRTIMKKYIADEYCRENIVISIAGNFDESWILNYLEDKLSSFNESKDEMKEEYSNYFPTYKSLSKDINQAHVCMCTKGVEYSNNDYYPTIILNSIMGGSMSSRFFQKIREEKGLAYSVYSQASSFTEDGYINIYAGIANEKIEETIGAIKDELNLLQNKGVTREEVDMAKQQLKGNYIFGLESISSRMFSMGKSLLLENIAYEPEQVIHSIEKVTHEDIMNIREKMGALDKYSVVCIADKEIDIEKVWKK